MSHGIEKILLHNSLPGIDEDSFYTDDYQDALYRSVRRKEAILEMMLKEGGVETLRNYMRTDPFDTDNEAFNRIAKKSGHVLQAIKELSVSLPTTSFAQIKTETVHRKAEDILPPPRHISEEELTRANLLYLEAKREEREFKESMKEKEVQVDRPLDLDHIKDE